MVWFTDPPQDRRELDSTMDSSPVTTAGIALSIELDDSSGDRLLVIEFGDKAEDLLDFTLDQAHVLLGSIQQALGLSEIEAIA